MLDPNFNQIIEMIKKRKNNAYRKVNEEMILLYLEVGKFLYELKQNSIYGDKITTKAAEFMKNSYPNIRGFTKRNIERMIQFYSTYKDDEIATPLVTQLSWTNNLLILSGSKTKEERIFYLQLSIKNNYSKRELDDQLRALEKNKIDQQLNDLLNQLKDAQRKQDNSLELEIAQKVIALRRKKF